jgi:hypothetical protein
LTNDPQVIEGPAGVIRGCEAFVVHRADPELYVAVLGGLELGAVVSTLSQPSAKTRLRA